MVKIGIIPSRFGSTRFPGKPLALINDKPMIQWVYENSSKSKLDKVIVATDDERIFNCVKEFGGNVMMTANYHINGSSRISEVAEQYDADIVINIQGDEPMISYKAINSLIDAFENDTDLLMATLKTQIHDLYDINNINNVKVVTDKDGFALYFSRSPIPFLRDGSEYTYYKHIGIYGYRKNFLLEYIKMEPSTLEVIESLEQLRVLENGYKIKVIETYDKFYGVDTKEDMEIVKDYLE